MTRAVCRSTLAAALTVALCACQAQGPQVAATPQGEPRLQVVTTVNIITDLAQQIGGERVQVRGLMGAGVDPHLYKASAGDVRRLTEAQVVLYGGHHLEGKMGEVLGGLAARPGVQVRAVMEAVPENQLMLLDGAVNPHLWFDPTLWKYAAQATAETLTRADPAGAATYNNNLRAYLAQLDELDRWSAEQLGQIPPERRVLVTAHDAFGYFARRYGFTVRGVQGVSTVAEAGGQTVSALAAEMAERRIPAIFVENTVSPRTVEAVQAAAAARGWTVQRGGQLFGDSAGEAGTPEGTYAGMLRHNVITIRDALTQPALTQPASTQPAPTQEGMQ